MTNFWLVGNWHLMKTIKFFWLWDTTNGLEIDIVTVHPAPPSPNKQTNKTPKTKESPKKPNEKTPKVMPSI